MIEDFIITHAICGKSAKLVFHEVEDWEYNGEVNRK